MDELAMLDRETFAQVWDRVDPKGTGLVELAPAAVSTPIDPADAALQELVAECLAGAETYRALARRSRRSGGELAALRDQKTAQARRLSAAYFIRSGVRYWPRSPLPEGLGFLATLRERYLAEGRLHARLTELAQTAQGDLAELYTLLAQETARMARQVRAVVEREM